MVQYWEHARLTLQSIKDKEIVRANRRREETNFQVGDLVSVRVFPINRTQLNEGGAFANRWLGRIKSSNAWLTNHTVSSSTSGQPHAWDAYSTP